MKKSKQEVITFKVDQTLADSMRHIPNRSEFIRRAILQALGRICPVCQGTGTLSEEEKLKIEQLYSHDGREEHNGTGQVHFTTVNQ